MVCKGKVSPLCFGCSLDGFLVGLMCDFCNMVTLPGMREVGQKCFEIRRSFASRNVLGRLILECVLSDIVDNVCFLHCCVFSVMCVLKKCVG